jgi:hypothetical protein
MYIFQATNNQIGEILKECCILSDLEPPVEPKLVIEFIKKHFGKYEVEIIKQALECWIVGKIEFKKPNNLNAQFISTLMYKCIRDGYVGKVHQYIKETKNEPMQEITKEMHEESLAMVKKEWGKYEVSKNFSSLLKYFEIQYEYIYRNYDKMNYSEQERLDMKNELINAVHESKIKQEKMSNPFMFDFSKITSVVPNVNWDRVTSVCLYFRKMYEADKSIH